MRRDASGRGLRGLAAGLAVLAPLTAQQPQPARAPIHFASPDGSRFVLIADPALPVVHWAVATPAGAADEPRGLEGLAMATLRASLGGTWSTGSLDAAREQTALTALDDAWVALAAAPGEAALQRLRECEAAATRLGDETVFTRVLAALPAHDPRIETRGETGVLHFTILPDGIAAAGRLLVERREQQALRGLPRAWLQEVVARQVAFDREPLAAVRAEVLALAMPDQPPARAAERPGRGAPQRDQALAVWHATQRPERTVHVLVGGFDAAAARRTLEEVFARTELPALAGRPPAPPRPIAALRRSTVPGTAQPAVALAWQLPPATDPWLAEALARWLGEGDDSHVGRHLRAAGRQRAVVRCRAPWPATGDGHGLLLVEVVDPAGTEQAPEQVLAACRAAKDKPPDGPALAPALTDQFAAWAAATADPRQLAVALAGSALAGPQRLRLAPPDRPDPRAAAALLAALFAGQPVIVEGRP